MTLAMKRFPVACALISSLLFGAVPSLTFAASAIPAEPDTERRTHYRVQNQLGPLSVGFDIYADGSDYANWIEVWVDGTLIPQSGNWTLSSASGSLATLARPITDATITFTAPQNGTVNIVGARRPRRTSQFQENRGTTAHDQNQVLTDLWMTHRERWHRASRALLAPHGEAISSLPSATSRANGFLAFDALGNPISSPVGPSPLAPPIPPNSVSIYTYGAIPNSVAPTSATITLTSGQKTATLSAAGSFLNTRGIVVYNAGAACVLNATACSSLTIGPPTAVVAGYAGANGGSTMSYKMRVAACDANDGCTAASSASSAAVAAPVLSRPYNAGASGNNVAWTVAAVIGATKYVWWRSSDGGSTYTLWTITDSNAYTDFINTPTISLTGRWSNTPLAAATKDDFVSSLTAGAGTTLVTLNDAAVNSGSFTAWPDDTVAINAAYTAWATAGAELWCPTGNYKVRTITAQPGMAFKGAGGVSANDNGIANGCVINGTDGDDIFALNSTVKYGPFAFKSFTTNGGRNTFYVNNVLNFTTWRQINIYYPNNAGFGFFAQQEEIVIEQTTITGGVYGLQVEGVNYNNKSSIRDNQWAGMAANCVSFNATGFVSGGFEIVRLNCSAIKQNPIYYNPSGSNLAVFDNLIFEATGSDLHGTATTATCNSGSHSFTLASVAGLAIGMDYTVVGCGANNLPAEGTICSIIGSDITLYDAACATPVKAAASLSGQVSTSAIFDDIYQGPSGQQWGLSITHTGLGTAGRYAIYSDSSINAYDDYFYGVGFLDSLGISNVLSSSGTLITPTLAHGGLFHALLPAGQQTAIGGVGSAAIYTTPAGGDFVLGLTDSLGTGSGTWGKLKLQAPHARVGQVTEFSVDHNGVLFANGGISPAGTFTLSPRNISTCGVAANTAASAFTDQTPVATEIYIAEVMVPANVTVTGVAIFNGSVASGNVKVGLADSAGKVLATSASTAMAGTSAYQRVPFTATYAAIGPVTYYVLTFYDKSSARANAHTVGSCGTAKKTGQVFATGFTTITPPTTFTTAVGPVANLY